jgi:hypothetical protein
LSEKSNESSLPNPLLIARDEIAKRIEEDLTVLQAQYGQDVISKPAEINSATFQFLVKAFDVQAYYHQFLVVDHEMVAAWYDSLYLEQLTKDILREAEVRLKRMAGPISGVFWPTPASVDFMDILRKQLAVRRIHWKGQALKRARELRDARRTSLQDHTAQREASAQEPHNSDLGSRPEPLSDQLNRLIAESRMSIPALAERMGIEPRSIYRHLSGESEPRLGHIGAYERVLTEATGRKVVISKTSQKVTKRHRHKSE